MPAVTARRRGGQPPPGCPGGALVRLTTLTAGGLPSAVAGGLPSSVAPSSSEHLPRSAGSRNGRFTAPWRRWTTWPTFTCPYLVRSDDVSEPDGLDRESFATY